MLLARFLLTILLEAIALNREDRAPEAPFSVLPGFLLEVSDACSLRPVGHAATGCPLVVLLALAGRRCDGFLTATSPPLPDPAGCECWHGVYSVRRDRMGSPRRDERTLRNGSFYVFAGGVPHRLTVVS